MRILSLLTVMCLLLAVLLMDGCAALPNTISPVVTHVSHASQHEPFTNHPTNYGFSEVGIQAHWHLFKGAFLDAEEGYNLNSRDGQACGGLYGGHEVFTATMGWAFQVKQP